MTGKQEKLSNTPPLEGRGPFWENPENIQGFTEFREGLPKILSPRLERRTKSFYRFQKDVIDYYARGMQAGEEGQIDYLINQRTQRRYNRLMKDILAETGQIQDKSKISKWFGFVSPKEKPEDFRKVREEFEKDLAEDVEKETNW